MTIRVVCGRPEQGHSEPNKDRDIDMTDYAAITVGDWEIYLHTARSKGVFRAFYSATPMHMADKDSHFATRGVQGDFASDEAAFNAAKIAAMRHIEQMKDFVSRPSVTLVVGHS